MRRGLPTARLPSVRRYWAIAFLAAASAFGQQQLRVGTPAPRPMGYRGPDGKPHGFVVDALQEAARRGGLTLEWKPAGDSRSNDEALRRGELDLIAGVESAERRREFFVTEPWWSSEMVVLVPAAGPVRDESQLAGKRVAIPLRAGQGAQQYYPGSVIVPVASAVGAADAVCQNSADAAVIAGMYLRELLLAASAPCRGVALRTLDSKVAIQYALIARPAAANAARTLKRELDSITADGTLAAIAARNPPVSTPQATRLAELLRISYARRILGIASAAGALLLIVCGVFLGKQIAVRRRLRSVNEELREDLEARARAEAALRESEARFRSLFESAPLAVLAFDAAGTIVFANSESRRMFGRDTLVGVPVESLLPESARGRLDAMRRGAPEAANLAGLRAGGAEFPIEIRLGAVIEPGGLTLAFIADASERAALQQQLIQSQKLESVGQLAGGVAHDFNNLLTVIAGYAQMGLEDLAPGDPLRDPFTEIAEAASRAASLTGQLLAFSRRQSATPRVLSLNELLRNVEKMLGRLIGENIELVLVEGEIGSVLADPGQLEQVVMNLAVNARDAMPGGGRLTIATAPLPSASGREPGNYVALRVTDTGTGMSPEVRARIFEPFFTTKEKGKGTGLGLSTVYGIVKQAGGEVLVESEPGQGTTFTVVLPVAEAPVESRAESKPRPQSGGNETVLVAEDEAGVRGFVCAVLSSRGYRVLEASSGREALDLAARHDGRIDLLVSDLVMPGMDGFELATILRRDRPEVAVLHMSGYTDRGVDDGSALIWKPFSASALLAQVRDVLDGRPT